MITHVGFRKKNYPQLMYVERHVARGHSIAARVFGAVRVQASGRMLRLRVSPKHAGLNTIEKSLGHSRVFSCDVPFACQIATKGMSYVCSTCSQLRSTLEKLRHLRNQGLFRSLRSGGLRREFSQTSSEPRKTCLYDVHVENKGKIVNFAGWLLPVQYNEAIAESHQHTRTFASIFDVGHMLQTRVTGHDAAEYLESLTTSDLRNLGRGRATLTVFTNDHGGIMDDLIVTKDEENRFFVVSNAGRRQEDAELLSKQKMNFEARGKKVNVEFLDPLEQGLIALQGPLAAKILQALTKVDLSKLPFMSSVETKLLSGWTRVSRCGYTGEDGFEISVPGNDACELVEKILRIPDVKLAGLGARDSLRLEAGLCLYGNDIDETTTPVEAGLTWLIAKRRRTEANFPGAEKILSQIKFGPTRKRIGLTLIQGPPARKGATILTPEGVRVGNVTSGGPSPSLGHSIAMGYIPTNLIQKNAQVLVEVRGKAYKATITKMPFVSTKYYIVK